MRSVNAGIGTVIILNFNFKTILIAFGISTSLPLGRGHGPNVCLLFNINFIVNLLSVYFVYDMFPYMIFDELI